MKKKDCMSRIENSFDSTPSSRLTLLIAFKSAIAEGEIAGNKCLVVEILLFGVLFCKGCARQPLNSRLLEMFHWGCKDAFYFLNEEDF